MSLSFRISATVSGESWKNIPFINYFVGHFIDVDCCFDVYTTILVHRPHSAVIVLSIDFIHV